MAWEELSFVIRRKEVDKASGLLFGLGAAGTQEDHLPGQAPPPRQPWDTGPPPPPPRQVVLRAWLEDPDHRAVETAMAVVLPGVEARWVPVVEEDWEHSWKRGLAPLHISERLVVAPPWDAPEGAVIIEPGQGFGTGAHPTTRAALEALDALADQVDTVLDVGCGSGVLAIAAARLGCRARGVDSDTDAVADAAANARRNEASVVFDSTPVRDIGEPADLVLANLYAEALVELREPLVRLTRRYLVLAGILADREDLVRRAFDPHLALIHREVGGEWVSLRYARSP